MVAALWQELRSRPSRPAHGMRLRWPGWLVASVIFRRPRGGRSPSQNNSHPEKCTSSTSREYMPTRHCVRCGPSYTPRKKGTPTSAQFLDHVYCGQMAVWMKTPLGTEVDLGPGHIVLDGVPAPAKGAQQPPLFGPCLLWPRSPISATAEF